MLWLSARCVCSLYREQKIKHIIYAYLATPFTYNQGVLTEKYFDRVFA
jgi:hypothetical protein